jgi:G:T-mismatch repair DNA endonuclease (very short patch repair protein)
MPSLTVQAKQVVGSDLEIKVYDWLIRHGFRPGIDFVFQSQLIGLRGVRELGDAIADFVLIKEKIVWRVQGEYWHSSTNEQARDTIQKERLEGLGYTVVDLWQADLTDRFEYTMSQAVQGEEVGA